MIRFMVLAFFLIFNHAKAFALGADAWNTGFIIDFNEQWLREDAYNRAMSQAKKDMKPSASQRSSGSKDFKTDPLYTGPQTMSNNEFLLDDTVWKLAGMFPQPQRKQAAAMFTQIISSFNDNVEKLYGVPKENVATGMVTLLAGAYTAYYNKPFPERMVKPTVEQVGDYLRKNAEEFKDKSTYKRQSYQIAVGIGMLLQLLQQELQKNPNPAHAAELKQAGANVFKAVLKTEPERVRFTSSGMVFD